MRIRCQFMPGVSILSLNWYKGTPNVRNVYHYGSKRTGPMGPFIGRRVEGYFSATDGYHELILNNSRPSDKDNYQCEAFYKGKEGYTTITTSKTYAIQLIGE